MLESSAALCPEFGLNTTQHCKETNMEKNPNNNPSTKVPPRSSSTGPAPGESKPKTDGKNNGGSKRYSRKREPAFPKADTFPGPRRTNSQKSKNFDKRPPQRGGGRQYGTTGGGRREEVAETRRAEFSPAQLAGPKKISLNHLLNFTFEPRGGSGGIGDGGHSGWGRRNKWGHKNKPFNKELFLQANCQFVVSDDQDYKAHFTDPDTLVNWDCVQQVRIYSHEVPSCPICLYPPVAARITRCGHIFCWPCMLHYLSLSDKSWSKCPICYEAVHTGDLKSVVAMETRQYVVGDKITMRLMRREKGALVAMPSSEWVKVEEPVRFGDACLSPYSKLLLTSSAQALGLVTEEKAVLQTQLSQEEDAQRCFIQSALCLLQEQEEKVLQQQKANDEGPDLSTLTLKEPSSPVEEVVTNISSAKPVLQYSSAFDDEVVELTDDSAAVMPGFLEAILENVQEEPPEVITGAAHEPQVDVETPATQAECGRPSASVVHGPYYYFYQADDCQQMFLHPVNVRCLLREYGSLEACPDYITATVVEIVGHTVTEEIRRRHRYLGHLPLTCEFSICELALQPPILSKETLDTFADDLEKRKRLRQKKARDEKRREKRIEMEENKKQGKYPEVHIGLENLHHFPAFGSPPYNSSPPTHPEFTFAPPSPLSSSPASDGMIFPSLNVPSLTVGSVEDDSHCMSFAQMLRDGKARGDVGPRVNPKKDKLLTPPAADSEGESDGSDRVPVPSFQNSFSQAFEKALLELDNVPASPPQPVVEPGLLVINRLFDNEALHLHLLLVCSLSDEKGGKKKKKKQKLLFSTSMVHTK
ncbi:LOW QUALITY PROTEIN: E3 ubiquitin-protein ligase RNF10 [Xenentodon cancila]